MAETKKEAVKKEAESVMINIPKDPLNPHIKTFDVTINGRTLRIERGKYVRVPKNYADVAMESLKNTSDLDVGTMIKNDI